MGFDPELVGLKGERITSPYDAARPNSATEFHIGIDISSSRKARNFRSGVHGTVVNPIGGDWGTITVVPFHNQLSSIQYLHCSRINVKVNQLVAPWTVLGKTGHKAPPASGVTGYHLHLHVIEPGKARRSIWNLNFVDPTTWVIRNPLLGQWGGTRTGRDVHYAWERKDTWTFTNDSIGSVITCDYTVTYREHDSNCWHHAVYQHKGKITSRTGNRLKIEYPSGQCYVISNCDAPICHALPESGHVHLINSRTLRAQSIGGSDFDLRKDQVQDLSDITIVVEAGTMESEGVGLNVLNFSPFDVYPDSGIEQFLARTGVSMDGYHLHEPEESQET